MIYLDNAATTKPCNEAVKAVAEGLENFGNPSSLHNVGVRAEQLVDTARTAIAKALGCEAGEIYFTSGATESNNTAVFGAYKKLGKRMHKAVVTTVEHPSVAKPFDELERMGVEVVRISPRDDGEIHPEDIVNAVDKDTFLVSAMLVNNETGSILPADKAFGKIKKKFPQVITHCDCVQGFMKVPVKVKRLNADIVSLSGHKIYAPKGIGAIYVKKGLHIPSLVFGGGQEKGFRSGTESVPLINAFGKAVESLSGEIESNLRKTKALQEYLIKKCEDIPAVSVNYHNDNCSPYITSIAVKGLKSEVLLHFLESEEIYVSSGSACSKGKKSGVLEEFKIPEENLDSTLRVSFSVNTSEEDIDKLCEGIEKAEKSLAHIR